MSAYEFFAWSAREAHRCRRHAAAKWRTRRGAAAAASEAASEAEAGAGSAAVDPLFPAYIDRLVSARWIAIESFRLFLASERRKRRRHVGAAATAEEEGEEVKRNDGWRFDLDAAERWRAAGAEARAPYEERARWEMGRQSGSVGGADADAMADADAEADRELGKVEGDAEANADAEAGDGADLPSATTMAYDLFFRSVRGAYRRRRPSEPFPPDLDRRIAARWDAMEPKLRAGYERMAAAATEAGAATASAADERPDRRLDLSVVAADGCDCPDLEPEMRISVEGTSTTLAEVLRRLRRRDATAAEGGAGAGRGDLELVGVVVGRHRRPYPYPSAPAPAVDAWDGLEAEAGLGTTNLASEREDGMAKAKAGAWTSGAPTLASARAAPAEGTAAAAARSGEGGGEGRRVAEDEPDGGCDAGAVADADTDVDTRERAVEVEEDSREGVLVASKHNAGLVDDGDGSAMAPPLPDEVDDDHATDADNDASLQPPKKKRKTRRAAVIPFEENLEELRRYRDNHGHCNVPTKQGGLGRWVKRLRMGYKHFEAGTPDDQIPKHCRGLLNYDRIGKLEEIGFRWVVREQKKPETFESRLEQYIKLREEAGGDESKIKNKSIRCWVSYMRMQYRKFQQGKPAEINEERIAAFEKAGIVWSVHDMAFEKRLEALRRFKRKHGDLNVTIARDRSLHLFLKGCRQSYYHLKQGKPSTLTWERIQQLSDVGVRWESAQAIQADFNHETIMREFRQFKERHGHVNIGQLHPTLGRWVQSLRVRYRLLQQGKPSTLTAEHIKDLEEIGFGFDGDENLLYQRQEKFEEKLRELKAHKEIYGDCEHHPKWGKYIKVMRRKYQDWKDGKKPVSSWTLDQCEKLAEIGVDLSAQPTRTFKTFEEWLEVLTEYKAQHGTCNVEWTERDRSLNKWTTKLRKKYADWREVKPSNLTAEQVEQLYALGFDFDAA